eukprot:10860864-Heterocapsa_arctica.AAC.1
MFNHLAYTFNHFVPMDFFAIIAGDASAALKRGWGTTRYTPQSQPGSFTLQVLGLAPQAPTRPA